MKNISPGAYFRNFTVSRLRFLSSLFRTNPEKFSIENGTFRKRSPEWKNLKTPASRISVDGEHFENETFETGDAGRPQVAQADYESPEQHPT